MQREAAVSAPLGASQRGGRDVWARRGRRGKHTDAGEEHDAENKEKQAEAAGRGAGDELEEETDGLAAGDGEEGGDVGQGEEQGEDVDDAGDACRGDGEDNGFGNLAFGVLHLLAHGCHHAVAGQRVCCL